MKLRIELNSSGTAKPARDSGPILRSPGSPPSRMFLKEDMLSKPAAAHYLSCSHQEKPFTLGSTTLSHGPGKACFESRCPTLQHSPFLKQACNLPSLYITKSVKILSAPLV